MGRVIDQDRLLQVPAEHVEVLKEVSLYLQAGLAEHPMLDVPLLGIDTIEQFVCVDRLAGSKDDDLSNSSKCGGGACVCVCVVRQA